MSHDAIDDSELPPVPPGTQRCPNCKGFFAPNGHEFCRRACADEHKRRQQVSAPTGRRSRLPAELAVIASLGLQNSFSGIAPPRPKRF